MDSRSSSIQMPFQEFFCKGDLAYCWVVSCQGVVKDLTIWYSDKELASVKEFFLSSRWLLSLLSPAVSRCPHVRGRGPTHGLVSLPCLATSCWPRTRQHNLNLRLRPGRGKLRQKNLYILQYWIHVSFLISYSWIFIIFKNFWRFASSILPCFSRHGPRDKMWLTILALALAPTKER